MCSQFFFDTQPFSLKSRKTFLYFKNKKVVKLFWRVVGWVSSNTKIGDG
jgi:hypothetical protein